MTAYHIPSQIASLSSGFLNALEGHKALFDVLKPETGCIFSQFIPIHFMGIWGSSGKQSGLKE